jgi:hypothetical protein
MLPCPLSRPCNATTHPAKLAGVLRTATGSASLTGQLAVRSTRAQHLAQNAASRQRRDALGTIAQDSLQHVLVIPPECWPGTLDPCWRP